MIAHRLSTVINADKIAVIGTRLRTHKLKKCSSYDMFGPYDMFHILQAVQTRLKDSGSIVEIGSHEELLKKKGAYFSLINTQL